nr:unnamed protein product [Callosobruchus analis]
MSQIFSNVEKWENENLAKRRQPGKNVLNSSLLAYGGSENPRQRNGHRGGDDLQIRHRATTQPLQLQLNHSCSLNFPGGKRRTKVLLAFMFKQRSCAFLIAAAMSETAFNPITRRLKSIESTLHHQQQQQQHSGGEEKKGKPPRESKADDDYDNGEIKSLLQSSLPKQ